MQKVDENFARDGYKAIALAVGYIPDGDVQPVMSFVGTMPMYAGKF